MPATMFGRTPVTNNVWKNACNKQCWDLNNNLRFCLVGALIVIFSFPGKNARKHITLGFQWPSELVRPSSTFSGGVPTTHCVGGFCDLQFLNQTNVSSCMPFFSLPVHGERFLGDQTFWTQKRHYSCFYLLHIINSLWSFSRRARSNQFKQAEELK